MKPLTRQQVASLTPQQQQEYVTKQRQAALTEMRNNPTAVAERLRARGATEEQVQRVFRTANVQYPSVEILPHKQVPRDPLEIGGSYTAPVTQIQGRAPAAAEMSEAQAEDILKGHLYTGKKKGTTASSFGNKIGESRSEAEKTKIRSKQND
jgi:hypothetical protein